MKIDEIVASAPERNGLVGKTLFGLTIGLEYGVHVGRVTYAGTFYGIEGKRFILQSGSRKEGDRTILCDRSEISLGARPQFYLL